MSPRGRDSVCDREGDGRAERDGAMACQWANGKVVFVSNPKATYDM